MKLRSGRRTHHQTPTIQTTPMAKKTRSPSKTPTAPFKIDMSKMRPRQFTSSQTFCFSPERMYEERIANLVNEIADLKKEIISLKKTIEWRDEKDEFASDEMCNWGVKNITDELTNEQLAGEQLSLEDLAFFATVDNIHDE